MNSNPKLGSGRSAAKHYGALTFCAEQIAVGTINSDKAKSKKNVYLHAMKLAGAFLRLIRYPNLIFIGITQFLFYLNIYSRFPRLQIFINILSLLFVFILHNEPWVLQGYNVFKIMSFLIKPAQVFIIFSCAKAYACSLL